MPEDWNYVFSLLLFARENHVWRTRDILVVAYEQDVVGQLSNCNNCNNLYLNWD